MSATNLTKTNATGAVNYPITGAGWDYDQPNYTYDIETDPFTGQPVYYDSTGLSVTATNLTKNAASSPTNQVKNTA